MFSAKVGSSTAKLRKSDAATTGSGAASSSERPIPEPVN
jgi:hypothetical protein